MLDVAQRPVLALEPVQKILQPLLALDKRQPTQILAVSEEKIEGEEDQGVGLALRKCRLQGAKSGTPAPVERHGLAVDHAVRQGLRLLRDGGEFLRPVQPLACAQHRLAVLDPQLQAIAVELDLVSPAGAGRRLLDQLGELRLDEARHRPDFPGLGLGGGDRSLLAAAFLVALPYRPSRPPLAGHERRRRPPGAEGDLLQGPSRGDRLGILQKRVLVALVGELVAMLDQQPVCAAILTIGATATTLVAVPLHAHQHPAAMQTLALEDEFQVAFLQPLVRVALGQPVAAIPELHRAAAILAFGNGALEVAVVERMVLDLDRQPLDRRIERRALGHRPRLEGAVELQAEIVVQPRGVVALHHEAQGLAGRDGRLAGRLFRQAEVALGAIGGETVLALFAHGLTAGVSNFSRSRTLCFLAAAMKASRSQLTATAMPSSA